MDLQTYRDVFPVSNSKNDISSSYPSVFNNKQIKKANKPNIRQHDFEEEFLFTNNCQVSNHRLIINPSKKPKSYDKRTGKYNVSPLTVLTKIILGESESEDEPSFILIKSIVYVLI